jgi:hypothetical protein
VDTRAISRSNDSDAGRLTAKKIFSGMTSIICLQGGAFIAADESLAGSCEPEAASVRTPVFLRFPAMIAGVAPPCCDGTA